MRRVVLYARVSTDEQSTENQLRELREVAKRHSWTVCREFVDRGISGAKGKEGRPQFNALHVAIARKECDMVMAWSVDRLGRSLKDLVDFLGQVHAKGVGLYLHQQGLDTTTPAGKALFGMMGVFAEFERSMIQERVKAGLSRARAKGIRLGRPPLAASAEGLKVQREVLRLRKANLGMCAIADKVGISSRTVMKIVTA